MSPSPVSPALRDPLANRVAALSDVALILNLISDLHPEWKDGETGRLYSDEAEQGKAHLINEAARIVGAVARAEGGAAPDWRDAKPLHWTQTSAEDKIAEARRVMRWIAEHFTNARDPLELLGGDGARGLGLLVGIMADMLEDAEHDCEHRAARQA